jgi:hypothetical protein
MTKNSCTIRNTVLPEKLIVVHLGKDVQTFIDPEDSFAREKLCPEADESSSHPRNFFI